jgi:hypothetical protein
MSSQRKLAKARRQTDKAGKPGDRETRGRPAEIRDRRFGRFGTDEITPKTPANFDEWGNFVCPESPDLNESDCDLQSCQSRPKSSLAKINFAGPTNHVLSCGLSFRKENR